MTDYIIPVNSLEQTLVKQLSNLYGEYQAMTDDCFKCAKAIDRLETEMNASYQMIGEPERILESATRPEERKEIKDILTSYKLDMEIKKLMRNDLEGDIEKYDLAVKSLQRAIENKKTGYIRAEMKAGCIEQSDDKVWDKDGNRFREELMARQKKTYQNKQDGREETSETADVFEKIERGSLGWRLDIRKKTKKDGGTNNNGDGSSGVPLTTLL